MSNARSLRFSPNLAYALGVAPVVALGVVALLIATGGHRHPLAKSTTPAVALKRARAVGYTTEAPDPLAGESYPVAAGAVHHAPASSPRAAVRQAFLSPGAPSNAQVLAELHEEQAIEKSESGRSARVSVDQQSGDALAPAGLPIQIQEVIAGGNAIRDFPYVYGGGHASFIADAYDCSGSVSYALAAGGLIKAPETSGQLESWGAPGPGRYLTVFATEGHTFMYVDGVWFDTAGRAGPYSTRWLTQQPSLAGYVERHYPGL